ncbi:Helix-turn-helix [bacterium A37T11]|nr:Helix-turn-helix [bacterium A37T11]
MVNKFKDTYKRIGSNVKEYRTKVNLTQSQLAEKCGKMDRSKISDIENAKEDFMFSTLLEIAEGLGVDVEKLTKKVKKAKPANE